jgi:hypothetical protein
LAFQMADENMLLNKYVLLTTANYGHRVFVLNWLASLHRHNYDKYVIACMDSLIYALLAKHNYTHHIFLVPVNWHHRKLLITQTTWSTKEYGSMTASKIFIAYKFLEHDYSILFSDADVVFLNANVVRYINYMLMGRHFAYMDDQMFMVRRHL